MAKIDDLIDEIGSIGNRPDLRRWREEIQAEIANLRASEREHRIFMSAREDNLRRDLAKGHAEAQEIGRKDGLEEAAMMIEVYAHFLRQQDLGTSWKAIRQFADKIRFNKENKNDVHTDK